MSQNDAFDPFGLHETVNEDDKAALQLASFDSVDADGIDFGNYVEDDVESPPSPPPVSRVSRSSSKGVALPPKINIKMTIAEEVSSAANPESEGSSTVAVEGSVLVQVQCSDAMKNAPFCLTPQLLQPDEGTIAVFPISEFCAKEIDGENIVTIPKQEIGLVPVLRYTLNNKIQHMPLLLERKVTISGVLCRIAVQVRSKLTNNGNLRNFSIAVAVPECVIGSTIEIVRGEGEYDELKRTLLWKLEELQKGESFMVSAQAKLWEATDMIQFPVLLRCSSDSDQISGVEFKITSASGYPSSITMNTSYSFRLLHRLS